MNKHIRFKHPFTWGGGNLFLFKGTSKPRLPVYRAKFKGVIIWCYSEVSAFPREKLSKLGRTIQYQEILPENFGNAQSEPSVIILDDLLNKVCSREVCYLFTKGSHHRNISVLLLAQNFFHHGPNCRDISLNAKYLVLLKKVIDKK